MKVVSGPSAWMTRPVYVSDNINLVHSYTFAPKLSHQVYIEDRAWDFVGLDLQGAVLPSVYSVVNGDVLDVTFNEPEQLDYTSNFDQKYFSSVLGNIPVFNNIMSDVPIKAIKSESGVKHSTIEGVLCYGEYQSYVTADTQESFWSGLTSSQLTIQSAPKFSQGDGSPDVNNVGGSSNFTLLDLLEAVKGITKHGSRRINGNWTDTWFTLTSYELTDSRLQFVYESTHRVSQSYNYANTVWNSFQARTTVTIPTASAQVLRAGVTYIGDSHSGSPSFACPSLTTIHDEFYGYELGVNAINTEGVGFEWKEHTSKFLTPHIIVGKFSELTPDGDEIKNLVDRSAAVNATGGHNKFDQYYGSCSITSSNAVSSYKEFINTNYLESLSELNEVMSLIPDVSPIIDFLKAIPRMRLLAGALRLVDFAANTYLLVKFGLEPSINDIKLFAEKFDKVVEQLNNRLNRELTLRGKLDYDFVGGDLDGYHMTTRSKLRIKFPRTNVQDAFLPLSLAGLEPSSSTLWDLFPFSFAIDWFTGFGDKMKVGDNALYALTSQIGVAVHSFTLYKDLDVDTFCDGIPFTVASEGLQFKYYHRVVSKLYPMPGGTTKHYDWLGDSNVPIVIGTALAWSILRS